MKVRFNTEPPVEKIRAALDARIAGGKSVQQVSGKQEVLIVTEITDERQLNANEQTIKDTLRAMFGDSSGRARSE